MSNIALVWDNTRSRGDWQVSGGRIKTGDLLRTAVLISLFTDRVAQPDYVAEDGSHDRHGWWSDTFDGKPIGSRLWQLRRRKIANRDHLRVEARDMIIESLAWMKSSGIAAAVNVTVALPPAGLTSSGSLLSFAVEIVQPNGNAPLIRLLWRYA